MELAHATDDRLLSLLVEAYLKRRILLAEALEGLRKGGRAGGRKGRRAGGRGVNERRWRHV